MTLSAAANDGQNFDNFACGPSPRRINERGERTTTLKLYIKCIFYTSKDGKIDRLCVEWQHTYILQKVSSLSCYQGLFSENDGEIDMGAFPVENIRNFSIIAHVDHGKSTLADRLLEVAGVISKKGDNQQVLDTLQVERERGITVKAQTASLFYTYKGTKYLLNLIDTPGHVDFSYEVSRSLAACQGVLLLVDANQGVQAQTVANFYLAFESELAIIPVMNKIDLKNADPDSVATQLENLFDLQNEDCLRISAKNGIGIHDVLEAVILKVPPPTSCPEKPLKALLFDSTYDQYRGAIVNMAVIDGHISKGDKITSVYSGKSYDVSEVGIMHPDRIPTQKLHSGQVGYFIAGMYNIKEAHIGDTFHHQGKPTEPMPGFKAAKPMVFAGMYPIDQSEYLSLRSAIDRLTLNDSSVSVSSDSSPALGQGWRLGFLGLLHMDVFNQRLEQEHNANVIITSPSVTYKAILKDTKPNRLEFGDTDEIMITNPSSFPDITRVERYLEPMIMATIITPDDYIGKVINLCIEKRGEHVEQTYIDQKRVLMKYRMPLNEVVIDFFDKLKSLSSGYGSFDYEDYGYEPADLVKLNLMLNGKIIDELSTVVHRDKAREVGKHICSRLLDTIPRQLYEVAIQAAVGGKIVARETVKAFRKNVLAKCYGGDISRKMKLLKRQAEGKKRMRKLGNVDVPKEAFISVLKK
ncbi:translation factor Guf1, mitochondrial-like isoform X2 [Anneissia japonica]|uniref:translation factor Guf1, mitochondrial-like isoform X2 n=1 Tax=Anneissia japonica TaxID=1529436 RepID=UPI001425A6D0|nr:translation factor Guf1, mitochondrial-like isoform X2 [Anneissia japonica]